MKQVDKNCRICYKLGMNEPKETLHAPRLTIEMPLIVRQGFKAKCYADGTTMHAKILELIQLYLEN